jgi:tetratricopeptide (TPR) repeat protein
MNTIPWDYWQPDGSPKPATAEAKVILEDILEKFPDHPGANHLYIHLVEASPKPADALRSAQVLETSMPAAGHIVHMPAHIYLRVGQYARSLELNEKAVAADENYLANSDNRGMYRWAYYPHNIDFISYSAYMEGRSEKAIATALKLAYKGNLISSSNPVMAQHFSIEPMIAFTRFGKWTDMLALPVPDDNLIYSQLIYRFAKGISLLRTNRTGLAEMELLKLDSLSKLDTLKSTYATLNSVSAIAQIPLNLLRGEVLLSKGMVAEGLKALLKAVEAEDNLRYNEPPDWKIPSRQFLGVALLKAGKYSEAEKVFIEDLNKYPENGWSLYGLQQSQIKLAKKTEAAATQKRFSKAWTNSDIILTAAVF